MHHTDRDLHRRGFKMASGIHGVRPKVKAHKKGVTALSLLKGIAIAFVTLAFYAMASTPAAAATLWPYTVESKEEMHTFKIAFDVVVAPVDGRLPTAEELGAISLHLSTLYGRHDRTFVVFYLPDMKIGAGGWATAHHTPDMVVLTGE